MVVDDGQCLGIDQGGHHFVHRLLDQGDHLVPLPTPGQIRQLLLDPVHLFLVGAQSLVVSLGDPRPGKCGPTEEAGPEHCPGEGQRGRLGDDRLVEVEESRLGHHLKLPTGIGGLVCALPRSYVRAMTGRERTRVLAVHSADPVMALLGSIGLAAAMGTALLVDLADQMGSRSPRTLADVASEGPRLTEVSPGRRGVAVLRSGHLPAAEAATVVDALATRWPAVVVRLEARDWPGPTVPVRALYPGWLAPTTTETSVWQKLPGGSSPTGPGPVLPTLRAATTRRILAGGVPPPGAWLRAWRPVWEIPWG
jgi:hypothetical protein